MEGTRKWKSKRKLKMTYHAGEDFLDLTDGLRAIDEVIRFVDFTEAAELDMLALGLNPYKYEIIKIGK